MLLAKYWIKYYLHLHNIINVNVNKVFSRYYIDEYINKVDT